MSQKGFDLCTHLPGTVNALWGPKQKMIWVPRHWLRPKDWHWLLLRQLLAWTRNESGLGYRFLGFIYSQGFQRIFQHNSECWEVQAARIFCRSLFVGSLFATHTRLLWTNDWSWPLRLTIQIVLASCPIKTSFIDEEHLLRHYRRCALARWLDRWLGKSITVFHKIQT